MRRSQKGPPGPSQPVQQKVVACIIVRVRCPRAARRSATRSTPTARVREKLVTEGLDAVLMRKKRDAPSIEPIFDGERQARLIAPACSKCRPGRARWTIRLLAEQVVERKIVESAHFNTVARAL